MTSSWEFKVVTPYPWKKAHNEKIFQRGMDFYVWFPFQGLLWITLICGDY